ncbi:MAG: hypothetical protein ACOYLK_07460 [Sphingomonas sp.]
MRHRIASRAVVLAVVAVVAITEAPAEAADCVELPAGAVVDFAGPSRNYELLRNRQRLTIAFYSELRGGDQLRLLLPGSISIQPATGPAQAATKVGQWFCIRSGPPVTWVNNTVRTVGNLLTAARDGVGSLISRGDGDLVLTPTVLADGTARVGGGSRYLAFAWRGGAAPFSLELGQAGSAPLVLEADINARMLRLREPRRLVAGRYQLRVKDALGSVVKGEFTVTETRPDNPSSAAEAMATAGRLLSQGPAYAYDAFLVVSPFRAQSESASELMDLVISSQ